MQATVAAVPCVQACMALPPAEQAVIAVGPAVQLLLAVLPAVQSDACPLPLAILPKSIITGGSYLGFENSLVTKSLRHTIQLQSQMDFGLK